MISKFSQWITKHMIKEQIISEHDFDLYHYGWFVLLSDVFTLSFCLVVGAIFKILLPSALFYIVFYSAHRYAGGVHVKTELHCQIITLIFFFISILSIKYIVINNLIILVSMYLICAVVLIILSPADTPQKPLTKKERLLFRKITVCIITFSFILLLILHIKKMQLYSNAIFIAVILQTISVICGRLFNKRLSIESA